MTEKTYQSKITYMTMNEIFKLRWKCLSFSQRQFIEACPMQSVCSDGKVKKLLQIKQSF
jgi:hypothetical protein